jgi:hypothetical protein
LVLSGFLTNVDIAFASQVTGLVVASVASDFMGDGMPGLVTGQPAGPMQGKPQLVDRRDS